MLEIRIRFAICPELCAAMLVCPIMLDNEAELVHMHMSCKCKMGSSYELIIIIIMQYLKGFSFRLYYTDVFGSAK